MKSTTAILALAAAVHASTLTKRDDNKVPDVWENKNTLCKGWLLNTPEEADTLWTMKTKAGDHLDNFLRGQWEHQNNWLINLEDRVFGGTDGKSGAAGCSVLDNDCSAMKNMECTEQYENGLRIGQMVSDFGGNEDDTGDMVKWLASASAIGGALSGLSANPGFGVGLYLFGGIFSAFGNLKQEEIDQGSISAGLADLFEAAVDRLDETMRIVMGGVSEDQYNALKTSNPDPYKLPVANFFNGGLFLLNDNAEAVQLALNSVYGNIRPKVANNVMKAAQFYLVADKRRKSREDCGYATGRQWMALREGEEYCFYIMRHDPKPNRVGDWAEVSGEVYDKMASYGLGNREVYYRAILDCALSPNDDVDLGSLVGGKIPTCYFNLPAAYVDQDQEIGCGDQFTTRECDYLSATNIE
ncbi:hypothetical protein H9Q69_009016 [Fusarium xylarioides]|uniref:Uncharacterized protein n=1 Tax=Fusarium xylarioides TaxID=221167 RepID=A0A9P7L5S6_9HYPO|nr:hypothetical protein H9Q72_007253 [Fusarium xylarioides]KAG5791919.1 hypothetical protein H9Q69_009016 [Fusarium xylarioides]